MTVTLPVDPRVELTFARQGNHRTHWLEIEFPVGAEPTGMLADLAEIGWHPDRFQTPPVEKITWDSTQPGGLPQMVRHGYQTQELRLIGPKGSALFAGWDDDEKRQHMAAARKVLRKYGFTRVPVWAKTVQDMM
jgi:hypothetical protein